VRLSTRITSTFSISLLLAGSALAAPADDNKDDESETELQQAARQLVEAVELSALVGDKREKLDLIKQPVLRFGDIPRANDKGSVWIPAGEHTLSFSRIQKAWFDTSELETHLLSISGELLGNNKVSLGLEISYDSPNRCAMMFNKNPLITYVDGKLTILPTVKGDLGFTVLAPPGHHRLRVVSLTIGKFIVEFISLVTASLIVLFGVMSSGLLAILFVFIIINRRMNRIRRFLRRRLGFRKKEVPA